jgi:uncharacterized protein YndB with AHSA1/START domain
MSTRITAEKGKQDIWIERRFKATKELVFRLLTEAEFIEAWQNLNFKFKTYDCRDGGSYESSHTAVDGKEYGFKGVFHEIIPNERIIKTSEFLGLPFKVLPTLEIHSLKETESDCTELTLQIICNNEEVRDAMVLHGMQAQFDAIYSKFDLLISTIK